MSKANTTGTATKGKRAKVENATPIATATTPTAKRGRKSIVESMTPAEIATEIKSLLTELAATTELDAKKRIRRALRLRGHKGGLNKPKADAKTETPATK